MNLNNLEMALELQKVREIYEAARRVIIELNRQIAAQHRYIEELEKQLEPEVVAEIREELSAEEA